MDNKLRYIDRIWYVMAKYSLQSTPAFRVMFWKVSHGERLGALSPEKHDGADLHRSDSGRYVVAGPRDDLIYGKIVVCVDPQAQADLIEEIEFPCPKTRLETRYRDGAWQKYSKREGWISA
jgi:hypothetical protein